MKFLESTISINKLFNDSVTLKRTVYLIYAPAYDVFNITRRSACQQQPNSGLNLTGGLVSESILRLPLLGLSVFFVFSAFPAPALIRGGN